ncbi:MAG: putative zinc-binding metallopeptidase [Gammaproteobacteria bacterium]|nr:putative zinc-binding metallopeptidase [Gammaproteobacteria bacterium]
MKNFLCSCGQVLFFENTLCTHCHRRLGFDPVSRNLLALDPVRDLRSDATLWWRAAQTGQFYHRCRNDTEFDLCNWLVTMPGQPYCLACSLNQTVPGVRVDSDWQQRHRWWRSMEQAKRRLLFTLLELGLPVQSKSENPAFGLAFAFLEDWRSNPLVDEAHVLTGHARGLITVNLAEADHVLREQARQRFGEPYRTLLGHFRHESGHYYFEHLIVSVADHEEFRALFGDERADYEQAIADYYAAGMALERRDDMISAYAQVHPLEDWAECWAHYLHMVDTLETAAQFGLLRSNDLCSEQTVDLCMEQQIEQWSQVSVMLNSLNRSMGLEDAYPFVLSAQTLNKIRFVHRKIYPNSTPTQTVASVGMHP